MAKFQIVSCAPCLVSWYYQVEADNFDAAIRMIEAGDVKYTDLEVGDYFACYVPQYYSHDPSASPRVAARE